MVIVYVVYASVKDGRVNMRGLTLEELLSCQNGWCAQHPQNDIKGYPNNGVFSWRCRTRWWRIYGWFCYSCYKGFCTSKLNTYHGTLQLHNVQNILQTWQCTPHSEHCTQHTAHHKKEQCTLHTTHLNLRPAAHPVEAIYNMWEEWGAIGGSWQGHEITLLNTAM